MAAISALKTFDPPPTALHGKKITGRRPARQVPRPHIADEPGSAPGRAPGPGGWLHYRDAIPATPLKPGKGPIALRVRLDHGGGFDLTEQGTQKRLAAYLVRDPSAVPGVARLGPDALAADLETFAARIRSRRGQIKGVLTDQEVLAGIGNAYSDEILHRAQALAVCDQRPAHRCADGRRCTRRPRRSSPTR